MLNLEERKKIATQMAVAGNQLDDLANMLAGEYPDKHDEVRGASDMLAGWEIDILSDDN